MTPEIFFKSVLKDQGNDLRPFAFLDLSAFKKNLHFIKTTSQGKTLRLATKSIRSFDALEVISSELGEKPPLMTYDAGESAGLLEKGYHDILLAYPTQDFVGITMALEALKRVRSKNPRARMLFTVDHIDQLAVLKEAARGKSIPQEKVSVIVDIDASLRILGQHIGVKRSSLMTRDQWLEFFKRINSSDFRRHFHVEGVMTYDAQIAGLGDQSPFHRLRNPVVKWVRNFSRKKLAERRRFINEDFQAIFGRACTLHNGGGSGSLNWAATDESVTEVTAGSGLYCPHLFDYFSNISYSPSLYFALPVTRTPDARTITCSLGGYISSGTPGWDRLPFPVFPEGLNYLSEEGAGEVQTPLQYTSAGSSSEKMRVGDWVVLRPAKAGEFLEHFLEVLIADSTGVLGEWKTYRGE